MSNPKKVTLQWLRDILDKNELGEIEIDVMSKTVQFILNGHKLSSKRMSLEQAYDWIWAFIEGVRYEQSKNQDPLPPETVALVVNRTWSRHLQAIQTDDSSKFIILLKPEEIEDFMEKTNMTHHDRISFRMDESVYTTISIEMWKKYLGE